MSNAVWNHTIWLARVALLLISTCFSRMATGEPFHGGFLFDRFSLTLEAGRRTEAIGPLYYDDERESERTIAVPPLFSHWQDDATDSEEFDMAYPLLTLDRFGCEYRWQILQLLSFAGGRDQEDAAARRFTLFPFYFQQRSSDPAQNYTALLPIYGHLKNRLFRSEIDFVLWPVYIKTVKRPTLKVPTDEPFLALAPAYLQARRGDVTTYNYIFPFFHRRYGEGLRGWQFWPLAGHEHKAVTTRTNDWGDAETVPGHEKLFIMWPFFANQHRAIGTENPERQHFLLPFYNYLRSPKRDSTSYLWPVGVTITDDRERGYHEVDATWPLVVFAHGEGKTTRRVWPLFSQASSTNLQSNFYLWPLYKFNRIQSGALDRDRTRILFFLASDTNEKNTETGAAKRRTDFWPLFTWRRDFHGSTRLQLFAPLEPVLPVSKSIERNYSPLWSVWRAEKNPGTGAASQSFLWNLYRRETTPESKKCSLLFGLFQYQSDSEARRLRLFFVPMGGKKSPPDDRTK